MNIGVAIVTFNNQTDIASCVGSIRSEGLDTIAIVDSGSSDNTAQEISKLGCVYEQADVNRGFGYSANKAAALLNTEYVLFINPDAHIQKGAISHITQTFQHYPNAGIIGVLLCDSSGNAESMAYGDEPTITKMITRHMARKKVPKVPFFVDWVSGGAFLISKKVFDEVSGFDESFFMYWEDIDLCKQVREKGYKVLMDPLAKVIHSRGGSNMQDAEKKRIYAESADRYFKKHYAWTIWRLQRLLRKLYRSRSALL